MWVGANWHCHDFSCILPFYIYPAHIHFHLIRSFSISALVPEHLFSVMYRSAHIHSFYVHTHLPLTLQVGNNWNCGWALIGKVSGRQTTFSRLDEVNKAGAISLRSADAVGLRARAHAQHIMAPAIAYERRLKLGSTQQRLQVSPLPPVCNRARFSSRKLYTMGHQLHDDFEFPGDNGCRVPSDQLRFSLSRYIGCFPTASLMGIATGGSSSVPGSSGLWYPLHLHFRATAASFQHSGQAFHVLYPCMGS